ncbi:MAG: cupredoxin domain-containing protein, partial [Chloroflexi bacterium]|nr:cupredoxin domain-containing protein [Chloroflexota bacterium]
MSPDRILVTVVGLAAVAAVAWFFWFKRAEGVAAATMSDGYQEVMVLVKGGYTPDTIRVSAGKPVRLLFRREETAACSEQVVLADFGKSAVLPEG